MVILPKFLLKISIKDVFSLIFMKAAVEAFLMVL
jgi:hypothetical protein